MKHKTNLCFLFALFVSLAFVACSDKKKTEDANKKDTGKTEATKMPDWDASMDATKIPGYPARILGDTLNLKAYEFLAKPGDTIPAHEHPDHIIYVLEGGTAEIKAKDGTVQTAEFKTGSCMISGPQAHSAKNVGTTHLRLLIVHVYRPRG